MIPIRLINFGIFLAAFLTTFFLMKPFISKAKKKGFTVKDMYKKDKPDISSMGGLVILAGIVIALVFAQFFTRLMIPLLIFYFIVFMFALYGLTDDLLGFKGRRYKVWTLFLLALPIAVLTRDTTISLIFFDVQLGWIYAFIFFAVLSSLALIWRNISPGRPQARLVDADISASVMSYTVQAAVSERIDDAQRFKMKLENKGYKPFILKSSTASGKDRFIIYAGEFNDRESASGLMNDLQSKEGIKDSFVVNMPK